MEFFTQPIDTYFRNTDIMGSIPKDIATFISVERKLSYNEVYQWVDHKFKTDPEFMPKNPRVIYLEKLTPGNREKQESTLLDYLNEAAAGDHPLAPSLTTYLPVRVKQSLMGKFLVESKKLRSSYKKKGQDAKQEGDLIQEMFFYNLQTYLKVINNSFSGAQSSKFNALYNKSGHPTLTSVCGAIISYSNASNERMLAGNRHYWCQKVCMSAILATIRHTNYEVTELAMTKYNLHYPTPDEVCAMIKECTYMYFRDANFDVKVHAFVTKMTPIQRAAFLYKGDLFHLAKYNHDVIYDFIDKLSTQPTTSMPIDEAREFMGKMNYDTTILSYLINSDILRGKKVNSVMEKEPENFGIIAQTAKQTIDVLSNYQDLINGFLIPEVLPPSIHRLSSIVRKVVMVSDTDSSIFTTQGWVEWFTGKIGFCKKSYNIGYVMTFLASQMVSHVLKLLCANLGVAKEHMGNLNMKNEFYYPLFVLTSSAKNYAAYCSACEGNLYEHMELEIKGQQLRGSQTPEIVNNILKGYLENNLDKVMNGEMLTFDDVLQPIVDLEYEIRTDVEGGGRKYLATAQIKDEDSYAQGDESVMWQYHKLWEEVFAPKYGSPGSPPYPTIVLQLDLPSKKRITQWLDSLEDKAFVDRFIGWMTRNNKTSVSRFTVPEDLVVEQGIPIELQKVLNARKSVVQLAAPLHHMVESFGVYVSNDKTNRILLDDYSPSCKKQQTESA